MYTGVVIEARERRWCGLIKKIKMFIEKVTY